MRPEVVADGIWRIEAPLNGIGVSLYIVRGEGVAVIDTGYRQHPERVIIPALNALGIAPTDVDVVLNTHGHPDHLGGNAVLANLTGAAIAMHAADLYLAAGVDAHMNSPTDPAMALRALGWDDLIQAREEYLRARLDACRVDRVLNDGDLIDLGHGLAFTVVHTPGHSRGSVTYFNEARGIALVGDAVQGWGSQSGVLPLYYDPKQYDASLRRIGDLGAQTICLGHDFRWSGAAGSGGSVRREADVPRILEASRRFVVEMDGLVAGSRLAAPLPERVASVARRLQPPFAVPVDERGRFSAMSAATIIAHLSNPPQPGSATS